tara:strand:+ start:2111 stop:2572 length:462 start_codon:yes stop_codon:yes gene_type:complete
VKRKNRRLVLVLFGILLLSGAATMVIVALEDNIVFFFSPTEVISRGDFRENQRIRVGGLVKIGSWEKTANRLKHTFVITDFKSDLKVMYRGILPDLFREGQGVVAGGLVIPNNLFIADEVLAKHDENYMPPEVSAVLKNKGKWNPKFIENTSK